MFNLTFIATQFAWWFIFNQFSLKLSIKRRAADEQWSFPRDHVFSQRPLFLNWTCIVGCELILVLKLYAALRGKRGFRLLGFVVLLFHCQWDPCWWWNVDWRRQNAWRRVASQEVPESPAGGRRLSGWDITSCHEGERQTHCSPWTH